MKNEVEIYEVPTEEELDLKIYGTYEQRKKWTIESMDEEVLEYFNKKEFNGGFRYFLSAENTVAIAYETPVKFHHYDHESGMNVFDLRQWSCDYVFKRNLARVGALELDLD